MRNRRSWLWAICGVLAACSTYEAFETPAGACVQGQTASCSCGALGSGIATCGGDGLYGACLCGDDGASGGAGGTSGSTAGIGGASGTGAGGAAGTAGGGSGVSGGAGDGGAGGSAGGAGESGAGGSGGGSGSSGSGGSGSSGSGGSGGVDAMPAPAAPGELYGPCLNGGCKAPNTFCATTNAASYCTVGCGAASGGQCPAPSSGTVMSQCVFGFCVLGTCASAECPQGMECVKPSNSGQGSGLRAEQCVFSE